MTTEHGIDHVVCCRRNDEKGWAVLCRSDGIWHAHASRANGLVRWAIDTWLDNLKLNPTADLTFSTRTVEEIVAEPVVEHPADLAGYLVGGSVTVLLPERDLQGDLWSSLWRDQRGKLYGGGREPRFRSSTLTVQIEEFFKRENIKSFEPMTRVDGQPSAVPMNRPAFHRELLIRRVWTAASTLPEAYLEPTARPPRLTPEQEAARVAEFRRRRAVKEGRARTNRSAETSRAANEHNAKLAEQRSRPPMAEQQKPR